MKIRKKALTFEDVLLIPHKSEVLPKEVSLKTKLTTNISLNIPFISAAMDTVTESKMAIEIARIWWIWVIHKNMDIETQASQVKEVKKAKVGKEDENAAVDNKWRLIVAGAIWVFQMDRVKALVHAWVDVIVLDSAHWHSKWIIDTIKEIRKSFKVDIIAWNVATKEATIDLIEAWANAVKVWIWPWSICTTRIVTWVWVPQISAIDECSEAASKYGVPIIADWWIKYSWDASKALAVWASSVMMWSVLAKSEEAPWKIFEKEWKKYKYYRGMWSIGAMTKGSSDRYFQTWTAKEKLVPEWVEAMVELQGTVESILFQYIWGLRSSMWYLWAKDIPTFWKHAEFVEISSAGLKESHVHDVTMIKESPNY